MWVAASRVRVGGRLAPFAPGSCRSGRPTGRSPLALLARSLLAPRVGGREWRDCAPAAAHRDDRDAAWRRVIDRDRSGAAPPARPDHVDLRKGRRRGIAIDRAFGAGSRYLELACSLASRRLEVVDGDDSARASAPHPRQAWVALARGGSLVRPEGLGERTLAGRPRSRWSRRPKDLGADRGFPRRAISPGQPVKIGLTQRERITGPRPPRHSTMIASRSLTPSGPSPAARITAMISSTVGWVRRAAETLVPWRAALMEAGQRCLRSAPPGAIQQRHGFHDVLLWTTIEPDDRPATDGPSRPAAPTPGSAARALATACLRGAPSATSRALTIAPLVQSYVRSVC